MVLVQPVCRKIAIYCSEKGAGGTLILFVQTEGKVFLRRCFTATLHFSDAPKFLRRSIKIAQACLYSQTLR